MVVVNIQNEENSGGQTDKTTSNAGSQEAKLQVKPFLALKVTGTVKWFNVKSGYGFINRNDTGDDVFVHQSAIAKNNPKKVVRSVGDGETVEFDVVAGEKGNEAANVTGPGGEAVKGSPYAADRRGFHRQWYYRSSRTRPIRNQQKDGEEVGSGEGEDPNRGGDGKPRKFRNRRFMSGGSGYYRGRQSTGDKNGDEGEAGGDKVGTEGGAGGGGGGGRGRGARGRRSRYPFRGGRGGGKPNTQSDGDLKDGAGGEGMIQERGGGERGGRGGRGRGRPRYRRPNRSLSAADKQPKQSDDSGKTDKAEPPSEPPKETSQAVQNTTDESAA